MLRTEDTTGRTYEERMADALAALPLIAKEWTNHNASDPGITILENLVAFETLQGTYIEEMGNTARAKLLALAGFTPKKGKCARLLLSSEKKGESIVLNANEKFLLGNLVYETRKPEKTGECELTGVLAEHGGKINDVSFLTNRDVNVPIKIFGEKPEEGDRLYFISNSLPGPLEDTFFYITIDTRFNRNPIVDRSENIFASLKWECYTDQGFVDMKARDYTGAFLSSGEIKFKMPKEAAAVYEDDRFPVRGYCIRATLTRALYDIYPRFTKVAGFLFETWQKDSRSLCLTFQNTARVTFNDPFGEEGHILCFAKEKKGYSYKRYELAVTKQQKGRYCLFEKTGKGSYTLSFDRDAYGFEPAKVKDAVRVVIYSEEIMRRYRVGNVLGYDDQEISLPLENIVPDSFCLIAKRRDKNGEDIFDFVRPNKNGPGALNYRLLENEGTIVIKDAGDYIGAELFMGSAAVTLGPKGNIRAGNILRSFTREEYSFYNPGPGTGGAFRESLAEVRMRFREDIYTPYTCVTEKDYERVVEKTPGLCIKKVNAVFNELENSVQIIVMPGTDEEFPKLSEEYYRAIDDTISKRRLITTKCQIIAPEYAAVSVNAIVYVKRRYLDSKERITEVIRAALDYKNSDKSFGEVLKYEDLYHKIESLECVDYIYELYFSSKQRMFAKIRGSDVYPEKNCLLYPGDIDVEVITNER